MYEDTDGFSRWYFNFIATEPVRILNALTGDCELLALKFKYHLLKPGGVRTACNVRL